MRRPMGMPILIVIVILIVTERSDIFHLKHG